MGTSFSRCWLWGPMWPPVQTDLPLSPLQLVYPLHAVWQPVAYPVRLSTPKRGTIRVFQNPSGRAILKVTRNFHVVDPSGRGVKAISLILFLLVLFGSAFSILLMPSAITMLYSNATSSRTANKKTGGGIPHISHVDLPGKIEIPFSLECVPRHRLIRKVLSDV